jgi:hypothetical protein
MAEPVGVDVACGLVGVVSFFFTLSSLNLHERVAIDGHYWESLIAEISPVTKKIVTDNRYR